MNYYSVNDLCTDPERMWNDLAKGEDIVLTNNGKPSALIIGFSEGEPDEYIQAIRQTLAESALSSMRKKAKEDGYLSDSDITALVEKAKENAR